jgi:hypothetical protein
MCSCLAWSHQPISNWHVWCVSPWRLTSLKLNCYKDIRTFVFHWLIVLCQKSDIVFTGLFVLDYDCNIKSQVEGDWKVCRWPWQLFTPGKVDTSLLVTSNRCIPVKNTSDWSTVMFCACKIIQFFFSVVLWVVKAVHTFAFRLVINETTNKWWPAERRSSSDGDSCFSQDLCVFYPPS